MCSSGLDAADEGPFNNLPTAVLKTWGLNDIATRPEAAEEVQTGAAIACCVEPAARRRRIAHMNAGTSRVTLPTRGKPRWPARRGVRGGARADRVAPAATGPSPAPVRAVR